MEKAAALLSEEDPWPCQEGGGGGGRHKLS